MVGIQVPAARPKFGGIGKQLQDMSVSVGPETDILGTIAHAWLHCSAVPTCVTRPEPQPREHA